jgi:hypothetical protein
MPEEKLEEGRETEGEERYVRNEEDEDGEREMDRLSPYPVGRLDWLLTELRPADVPYRLMFEFGA